MAGPEIVTAAQMSRIAIDLGLFASSLQTFKDDIERIIAKLRDRIDETFRHWFGPRADAALSAAGQYIDAVDEAPAAIEAQIAIVDAAARFADVIEEELRPVENWLASTLELLSDPETANGALSQDEDDARSAIAEISARWVYARNQWFESALEPGNNALAACANCFAPEVPGVAYVYGAAYLLRLSEFSMSTGISLERVDPSGNAQEAATEHLDEVLDSGMEGRIIMVATETADDGGVDNRDEKISEAGALAMTDPEFARVQVQEAAEALGVTLSPEELNHLTDVAVANAIILVAGWDDQADEAVEDRLEAWRENEEALAQEAPAIEDIDADAVLAGVLNTTGDFDGFGVFVDGSASIVRATGEGGAAAVTTDWDAGLVTYSGTGLTSGSVNLSATGGGLLTNAQRIQQLEGWAICFTGAVEGGSGTICGGIRPAADGSWQFTDVVTIQGGPSASVVPGGSVSATLVHTDVVGSSRVVNLVREPVEWSVDSIASPWTEMWAGLGRFVRQAHS